MRPILRQAQDEVVCGEPINRSSVSSARMLHKPQPQVPDVSVMGRASEGFTGPTTMSIDVSGILFRAYWRPSVGNPDEHGRAVWSAIRTHNLTPNCARSRIPSAKCVLESVFAGGSG